MPIQFQVGGRYYADKPDGGPDWGLTICRDIPLPEEVRRDRRGQNEEKVAKAL